MDLATSYMPRGTSKVTLDVCGGCPSFHFHAPSVPGHTLFCLENPTVLTQGSNQEKMQCWWWRLGTSTPLSVVWATSSRHRTPSSSAPDQIHLNEGNKTIKESNREKAHTQEEGGRKESWQAPPGGQCDSVSLNTTNQETQILIFAVINFIQTSSKLTGFLWESSGNLMCL